jgi:PPOX class probable F420-dependent enzyme
MSTDPTPPQSHLDLLDRPLFAHLATVRPDGAPQSNVMWFAWDGQRIRMTHTKRRQKFQNFAAEPRVSLSITDPDDPYRFIEVRGVVESIEDDDEKASFYRSLQERYHNVYDITDAPHRVIVTIRPEVYVTVNGGTATRRR